MKRTTRIKISVLMGLLLCLPWLASSATAQPTEWTFMVYIAADNDLEIAAINAFLWLAGQGSDANVKILVLLDRMPGLDTRYGNWTDTRRGLVSLNDLPSDGTDGNPAWGVSIGEANMGHPQTLIDFVIWGMQNYPASRYAIVLYDHGKGWQDGFCLDAPSSDFLTMSELRQGLATIETQGQKLDLVSFDACLMGMLEVAYEIRDHAEVSVGSEETMTHGGLPFDTVLADLKANPGMSAASLGDTIVTRVHERYSHISNHTQSASDLSLINGLTAKVDSLAQVLRDHWSSDAGACSASAYNVMVAVDDTVISEEHGTSSTGSHGLAIYFPNSGSDLHPGYNSSTIQFPGATRWDEFLNDFYSSMIGSWVATARGETQGYHVCSSPSNYCNCDLYDFCEKLIENAVDVIWVEFSYVGTENGSFDQPYNTLAEAVTAATGGETICIKSGSTSEIITITKPVTLRACGGTVIIG
ncbi:MAG: clostripain-related cysteine peptidase [Planctomycetota bacterium]|jgi:hypothetical protein